MTAMEHLAQDRHTASQPTAFVNARLLDPETGLDQPGGLLVDDGRIADLGAHIAADSVGDTEIEITPPEGWREI